jgi:hypothetical protein
MGAPTSEVDYTSATTRRGSTKSAWACVGVGEKSNIASTKLDVYLKHVIYIIVAYRR